MNTTTFPDNAMHSLFKTIAAGILLVTISNTAFSQDADSAIHAIDSTLRGGLDSILDDVPVPGIAALNKVTTQTFKIPLKQYVAPASFDPTIVDEQVEFIDGFGRQREVIRREQSPLRQDLVQLRNYDDFNREPKHYQPVTLPPTGGAYVEKNVWDAVQPAYYQTAPSVAHTAYPYSETVFDNSPLNRVKEQSAPGEAWKLADHHTVRTAYGNNAASTVRNWTISGSTISGTSYYGAGSLFKTTMTDEDGNDAITYTDKWGRTVMEDREGYLTSYVYDDFDRLRFVITPKAYDIMSSSGTYSFTSACEACRTPAAAGTVYFEQVYAYEYDERGRVIAKKLPGGQVITYVYNKFDLPVLSQDTRQNAADEWLYTKYDVHKKPIETGLITSASSRSTLTTSVTSSSTQFESLSTNTKGYTNTAFPTSGTTLLSLQYYDDYDFDNDGTPDRMYQNVMPPHLPASMRTRGVLTGTYLTAMGKDTLLAHIPFYDAKGRLILQQINNLTGGGNAYFFHYDFTGKLLASQRLHTYTTPPLLEPIPMVLAYRYTYDHADRKRGCYLSVDNQPEVQLTELNYNELGQLVEKNYHPSEIGTFLQSVDYTYNPRGWLKRINTPDLAAEEASGLNADNDLFGMELRYEEGFSDVHSSIVPRYNGNITGISWEHAAPAGLPFRRGDRHATGYTYDVHNRLLTTRYAAKDVNGVNWIINPGRYDETFTYDAGGNILTALRKGAGAIAGATITLDDMSYTYNSNSNTLKAVVDADAFITPFGYPHFDDNASLATEYTYDGSGNMLTDENKDIAVVYNHLNLPEEITFANGKKLRYIYLANGQKIAKELYSASNTLESIRHYMDGIEYNGSTLDLIRTEEGRIVYSNVAGQPVYDFQYELKDHLGNTRVVFNQLTPGVAQVLQLQQYYAYGMQMGDNTMNYVGTNKDLYGYNGKEEQPDQGLDWIDYGARFYDAELGRWHVVDPLAEQYQPWSPYNYAMDNPIRFIDPDGRGVNPIYDTEGNLLGTDDKGLQGKAIIMDKDKFSQGMKHEEALKNSLGYKGLKDEVARDKYTESYTSLKDRPDYDGHITLDEANEWYRTGNGQPLYADLAKIDLSGIKQSDFKRIGELKYFQTLFNSEDGRVYGNIGLRLQQGGMVKGTFDDYNFEIKPYTNKTQVTPLELIIRNAATGIGHMYAGEGKDFRIYFNGTAAVKK